MRETFVRTALWLGVAVVVVLVALTVQQVLAPVRSGWLAMAQILAPHLALGAIPLVALAVVRARDGRRVPVLVLRVGLTLFLAIALVRFGPGLVSLPASPPSDAVPVRVVSWNLLADGPGVQTLHDDLLRSGADVVGLQELNRAVAAGLEADPAITERFPYRLLEPSDGSTGIGLLSRYPFLDSGWLDDPSAAWALLDLGDDRRLRAVTVHPLPARIGIGGPLGLPTGFEAASRDAALATLRARFVDPALSAGEPLLLFGDFNVTDREPGYRDLAVGLRDAHLEVGIGPGSTWRPGRLAWLPVGILRIDLVFTGGSATPVWITTDCTDRSDHCRVDAQIAVGG